MRYPKIRKLRLSATLTAATRRRSDAEIVYDRTIFRVGLRFLPYGKSFASLRLCVAAVKIRRSWVFAETESHRGYSSFPLRKAAVAQIPNQIRCARRNRTCAFRDTTTAIPPECAFP